MKHVIIALALAGCAVDTSTTEQDNCTSPPMAPDGSRPTRGKAQCTPANTAAQQSQLGAVNAAATRGVTLTVSQITVTCANGFCDSLWEDFSLSWHIHVTCNIFGSPCTGGVCYWDANGQEQC